MRKNIDIDGKTLKKLNILSAFEDQSVKALMEEAVVHYVKAKEKDRYASMTEEEREDMGLWLLMQEDDGENVSKEEIFKILEGGN